ncbi:MAG: hypothetical protein ACRDST_01300 [Pseudonocardiaceae bacterium]
MLTGSSRVFALRTLPDALPGRMEVIELWPFSQGEISGQPDRFVDAAFQHGPGSTTHRRCAAAITLIASSSAAFPKQYAVLPVAEQRSSTPI